MCEFISWKKGPDGHMYFLTDNDVFSPHGRETLAGTKDNDVLGHGAITAYYGKETEDFSQGENRDFWQKHEFPPEISKHLKSPETLLATWGKMLKQYLQPDDAYYIIKNAPEPWRSALADICIEHVVKDANYSYSTILYVKGLTQEQKATIVEVVAKSARYSYFTLCDVKGLTEEQRTLLRKASKGY
jgi:hypothetical protein